MEIEELRQKAQAIRKHIIEMLANSGSGHPGGSLSCTEIITALYFNILKHDPKNPSWDERDRFVMSKGHCCPAQYAGMAESGYFPKEELLTLRKIGSRLQGHLDRQRLPGLDASTGSLGMGLSISVGMAIAAKLDKNDFRSYCLMGDGEQDEGNVWEAVMSAAHFKLDNLCAIIDVNGIQLDGFTKDVMNTEPLEDKYGAFGWHIIKINGNKMEDVVDALNEAKNIKEKPTAILAYTVKGKGVSFMENNYEWHGKAPNKEEAEKAIKEIEEKLVYE